MNKNKISPNLLNKVSVLGAGKTDTIILSCNNFSKMKEFLRVNKYNYVPYRFNNCLMLNADREDLNILSNQEFVDYIYPNDIVNI